MRNTHAVCHRLLLRACWWSVTKEPIILSRCQTSIGQLGGRSDAYRAILAKSIRTFVGQLYTRNRTIIDHIRRYHTLRLLYNAINARLTPMARHSEEELLHRHGRYVQDTLTVYCGSSIFWPVAGGPPLHSPHHFLHPGPPPH